jgi:hypothetical protein
MRRFIIIVIASTLFHSCTQTDSHNSENRNITYTNINVECNNPNQTLLDSTFVDNITFNITTQCQENISYIDTVENGKDSMLIRSWKDLALIINSNKFDKKLIITKNSIGDSLASDLKVNGFMNPPFQIDFNNIDSSLTLKTFVGHADSDVGDIYVLKVTLDRKVKVIRIESNEMGE